MQPKPKMSRRELRAEKRRNEILDEAKAIFLEKDYSSVTMEEIAEASLISRVTLYQYFPSKNDLYGTILLRDIGELVDAIQSGASENGSTQEKITQIAENYMRFFRTRQEYFTRLSFFFLPGRTQTLPEHTAMAIEERLSEGIAIIRECIRGGIAKGEVKLVDADALALALWSQLMGYAYASVTGYAARHGADDNLVYRAGIEVFIAGISATPRLPGPASSTRRPERAGQAGGGSKRVAASEGRSSKAANQRAVAGCVRRQSSLPKRMSR